VAKKTKKEAEVESIVTKKIRFHCPKRGWVEEEIQVKRYKSETKEESEHSYSFIEEDEAKKNG